MCIMPLHSGALNELTSYLNELMVSNGLEILQEVEHIKEPFSKFTVYLTTTYITQFIHYGDHNYIT